MIKDTDTSLTLLQFKNCEASIYLLANTHIQTASIFTYSPYSKTMAEGSLSTFVQENVKHGEFKKTLSWRHQRPAAAKSKHFDSKQLQYLV